jgi:CelD/BcsL family acetyltransferase involved in cellulose biosynthesis
MSELRLLTLASLEDVSEQAWDELVLAMPRPSPFLLHAWLVEWWRQYAPGRQLAVHVAFRGERLAAALPLCVGRRGGLRVAEFLGGEQSHLADLLLASGEGREAAEAVSGAVGRMRIDYADLFGLPDGSRLGGAVGQRLNVLERVEAPVLDLPGGWEAAYGAKASSKTRNGHRRKWKRLAELGRLEARTVSAPEELAAAILEGQRLHALRWRGLRDRSDLTDERGRAAMRAGYRVLAERDVARVALLELDGRAVAFNAYFRLGDVLYSHRLAFDPELARFSPGLLCTLAMVEQAAEAGVRRVEWLGGTEDYKLQLMDRFEPLYEGLGLARTPQGAAAVVGRLATIRLRRRLKRSPALRRLYLRRPAIASP